MANRVRGIRQRLPANVLLGRLNGAGGPAQALSLQDVANSIIQNGSIPLPGGGGFITAVDSNFTVTGGTLSLHTIASGNLIANSTSGTAEPTSTTLTALIDQAIGATQGDLLYRNSTVWTVLAPGTSGQFLKTQGASANPVWATVSVGLTIGTTTISGGAANKILYDDGTNLQEATVGTGLTLSGGTLSASGGNLNNKGVWNSSSAYNPFDVVTYNGSAYLNYAAVSAAGATAQQWVNIAGMTISTTNTTNDTAVFQAGNGNCVGNLSKSSGKWYYEFQCSSLVDNGTQMDVSVTGGPLVSTMSAQFGGNIIGTASGAGSGTFPGLSNTKRGAIAVDITGALFWVTPDVTASPINWNGSTSNVPGVSGGIAVGSMTTPWVPAFYVQSSGGQKSILFTRPADFSIPTVPSGFLAWSTSTSSNTSPDQDDAHWLSQGAIVIGTTEVAGGSGSTKLLYDNSGVVGELTALPNGTTATTQSAGDNSTKVATTAYADAAGGSATGPTLQSFTSGSGTYTTPAGVKWIKIRMIGGGGGGGAAGTAVAGTTGGDTTFSTLTAHGGVGGILNAGGTGGAASGGNVVNAEGGDGGSPGNIALAATFNGSGGSGGSGCFGGSGGGGANGGAASTGNPNTGGGGGGGAAQASIGTAGSGGGGGSGGYIEHIILSPSATYSYGVGGGGAGNSTTTFGTAGAAGGSGYIVVEEHYNH